MHKRCLWLFLILIGAWHCDLRAVPATERPIPALMVDVDFFDHIATARDYYKKSFYGPEDIDELFKNCRASGVKMVTWRAMCQIASYHSLLNYNLGQQIKSSSDERRYQGAFAARIGAGTNIATPKNKPFILNRPGSGMIQKVAVAAGSQEYMFSGYLLSESPGAYLIAIDAVTNKELARGIPVISEYFRESQLKFVARNDFYVGIMADGTADIQVFLADALSLKDKSGKELLKNGDCEDFYMLQPLMWEDYGSKFMLLNGDFKAMSPERQALLPKDMLRYLDQPHRAALRAKTMASCDPLAEAVKAAHRYDIKIYAWLDPLDDGGLRLPPIFATVSKFHEQHPEYRLVDKNGKKRWGMLCFGYPEVRSYKTELVKELLSYGVDGIVLKTSYQHCMVWDGNNYDYSQFLFNDAALSEYDRIWGKPADGQYETMKLQLIYGNFFVDWLKELRPLFADGKHNLWLFQNPSKKLEAMCGGWIVDPVKIVENKLVDGLLLEPRGSGDYKDFFPMLDQLHNFSGLCRKNGVKLGFDYYLNGLIEANPVKDKKTFLKDQLLELGKEPFDFIGVYECMYVDLYKLWPVLKEVTEKMDKITPRAKEVNPEFEKLSLGENLAAFDQGSKALFKNANSQAWQPAAELIDGDISDGSSAMLNGIPCQIEVIMPEVKSCNKVRIYPGKVAYAANPSGECGPADFMLEGMMDGKWQPLGLPVINAQRFKDNPRSGMIFNYTVAFSTIKTDRIRITITGANDTGCRVSSPLKPIVEAGKRIVYVREIQILNSQD